MRLHLFALPALALSQFVPAPGNFPAKGDGDFAGGIFCISLPDLGKWIGENGGTGSGPEAPPTGRPNEGTGPYKAQRVVDSSLPGHTIYAPKVAPPGAVKLPFLTWGNGGCATDGAQYENFLLEIASYGYVIVANGRPGGSAGAQSKVQEVRDALDWAFRGGANKYGTIDLTKVATMGHSCGGLEAMSTAYKDERVKRIMLFNIGIFQDERRYLLSQINVPVAYFIGGPPDMGYQNSAKDYALLNAGLPAFRGNLNTGHGGTFFATNGGKQAKAAVAYLQWQFRDDAPSRAVLLDPSSPKSLVKDNWTVEFKNW